MAVANQSQRRLRRRVPGSMHWPSAPHSAAGRYSIQNATAKHSTAAALNKGLKGSSAVRVLIQAPLIPSSTRTNGTTQQTEAPRVARLAPTRTVTGDFGDVRDMMAMLTSVPWYGVKIMSTPTLTIGRLAAAANVNVETVRYYQRRGLLPEPERPSGSVRRYGADHLGRLQFIRRAQAMGFSLEEVQALQQVVGASSCEQTRLLTERKLADVRRRIFDLRRLEVDLEKQLDQCVQTPAGTPCPTLDVLKGRNDLEGTSSAASTRPWSPPSTS